MSVSLTMSSVVAKLVWNYENVLTWGNAVNSASFSYNGSMVDGTGAGQSRYLYIAQGTISASGTLLLDVAGSLTDMYGNLLTFARIKVLYFELTTDTTASAVSVGGHATLAVSTFFTSATDSATDQPAIKVLNGGVLLLGTAGVAGYTITATTADILRIHNLDATYAASLNIVIVGE